MEKENKFRNHESEKTRETKNENRELTEEAKAAATRERAEYLVKEVKQNTQQIQNILIHMQQVVQALELLRTQLELVDKEHPTSLTEDAKQVEKLKQKITDHKKELLEMKREIIQALEMEKQKKGVSGTDTLTEKRAHAMITEVLRVLNES